MQRRRGSSGLNWKPHLIFCGTGLLPCCSGVNCAVAGVPFCGTGGRSYAISVGTLSEVMPFPPGHLWEEVRKLAALESQEFRDSRFDDVYIVRGCAIHSSDTIVPCQLFRKSRLEERAVAYPE